MEAAGGRGEAAPFPGASDDDKASDGQKKQQDKREKGAEEAGEALDEVRIARATGTAGTAS
ncbi:hypothetical protein ACHZ98_26620 [Streptomyces sp. MAR4 CNY-716]